MRMAVVAGIDGCRGGWLCLTKDLATGMVEARILTLIDELLDLDPRPAVAMIDIPIGMPEAGPRACDREARARLGGPRRSSVFPAPIRPMLAAATYEVACRIGAAADGRKLSRQAWGIVPKIREVDGFVRAVPGRLGWLREVHPEVSFCVWNGGRAMAHGKKSAAGRAEREKLLGRRWLAVDKAINATGPRRRLREPKRGSQVTIGPTQRLITSATGCHGHAASAARRSLTRGRYAADDLLDAFAALWTAERVAAGREIVFPADPPVDACGLPMEIVA